jgi:hypothetical protein
MTWEPGQSASSGILTRREGIVMRYTTTNESRSKLLATEGDHARILLKVSDQPHAHPVIGVEIEAETLQSNRFSKALISTYYRSPDYENGFTFKIGQAQVPAMLLTGVSLESYIEQLKELHACAKLAQ